MSDIDGGDIYEAVLRLAYRDGTVEGEEMDWLRRMAELLDIEKDDRKRIQGDVRYASRMGQLTGDDEPADVFRRVCAAAWANRLGEPEVEAISDMAAAFGFSRARAEGILAGEAPAGATVPDLPKLKGPPREAGGATPASGDSPAAAPEAGTEDSAASTPDGPEGGSGLPLVEMAVVGVVVAAVVGVLVL